MKRRRDFARAFPLHVIGLSLLTLVFAAPAVIGYRLPEEQWTVSGSVRHVAVVEGKGGAPRQPRIEVALDDGRVVNADSFVIRLPKPGERITLIARRNWIGFTSYRREPL